MMYVDESRRSPADAEIITDTWQSLDPFYLQKGSLA